MPLYIFVTFHAKPGLDGSLHQALLEMIAPTRGEAGCRNIRLFRSVRDPAVFVIHSEWDSEADFDAHSKLPHTERFVGMLPDLLDRPLEVSRTEMIG